MSHVNGRTFLSERNSCWGPESCTGIYRFWTLLFNVSLANDKSHPTILPEKSSPFIFKTNTGRLLSLLVIHSLRNKPTRATTKINNLLIRETWLGQSFPHKVSFHYEKVLLFPFYRWGYKAWTGPIPFLNHKAVSDGARFQSWPVCLWMWLQEWQQEDCSQIKLGRQATHSDTI